ncbi:TetR/AcrR family transcriptional regulator [Thalassobaculum sp.]|uniref:TetR/AcrR family transcriptional regulator n=1 Tax=Thalassobaculum sp. TaxID=2022740 RepID=UPI003B5CAF4C
MPRRADGSRTPPKNSLQIPCKSEDDGQDPKTRQILNAAAAAFMEHGFGPASVDLIARNAGVSKATVYTRFASKEAMFEAVVERERRRRHLDDVLTDSHPDFETRLRAWAAGMVRVFTDPITTKVYRMVVAESPRFPELGRAFYRSAPMATRECLARQLELHGAEAGLAIDDPMQAAADFIGLLRGDLQLRVLLDVEHQPDANRIDAVVDHAVRLFLRAYRT